jgi:N utilization substance protein B
MMTDTPNKTKKINPRARTLARQRTLQGLYQCRVGLHSPTVVETQFMESQDMKGVDLVYFKNLLHTIVAQSTELDEQLANWLDRSVEQLDPIEHGILHIGLYELQQPDMPWRVVINESINLAKKYGATDSHKYINGILDKAAQTFQLREKMQQQASDKE